MSLFSQFTRPRPVAWLFFIAGFSLMMGLCFWQLERLAWKTALIENIKTSYKAKPLETLPENPADIAALEFHRVRLTGTFLPNIEFHVTPRYYRDAIGYHLFTPFRLSSDNRIVIINRGWVEARLKNPLSRPESLPPKKEVTIDGLIRIGADRNHFTPISQIDKNIWFGRDTELMAKSAKLKDVLPLTIDAIGEQKKDVLPIPSTGVITLMNDHLQYAITWALIALGILVIFLVYHHKPTTIPVKK